MTTNVSLETVLKVCNLKCDVCALGLRRLSLRQFYFGYYFHRRYNSSLNAAATSRAFFYAGHNVMKLVILLYRQNILFSVYIYMTYSESMYTICMIFLYFFFVPFADAVNLNVYCNDLFSSVFNFSKLLC